MHHGPFHPGMGGFGGPGDFFLPFLIARLVFFILLFVIPWIIGLTYVRRDANRRGQPGWLWALVTFPFGWLAVLAYLLVRAASGPRADTNLPLPPPAQPNLT
jgi:hypothetical protein